jgi:hypothetical protein
MKNWRVILHKEGFALVESSCLPMWVILLQTPRKHKIKEVKIKPREFKKKFT